MHCSALSAFLKVWYEEGGARWGTLRQSPGDNADSPRSVTESNLRDALDLLCNHSDITASSPYCHLVRAFSWLNRAFQAPCGDVRGRALFFSIALETTLSPDSYAQRKSRWSGYKPSLSQTKGFALRLARTAARLGLPSPPFGWSFEVASERIYGLRSILVHGDNILTEWKGVTGSASHIEHTAQGLYQWTSVVAAAAWRASATDSSYRSFLSTANLSAAARYWET